VSSILSIVPLDLAKLAGKSRAAAVAAGAERVLMGPSTM
jgi:hypothetical protein